MAAKRTKTRMNVTVSMDKKMHDKLILISFVCNYRNVGEKISMSEIINHALVEYFDRHENEFAETMDEINKLWGDSK